MTACVCVHESYVHVASACRSRLMASLSSIRTPHMREAYIPEGYAFATHTCRVPIWTKQ